MQAQPSERIKKDVVDQLYWDSRIDASDIKIAVEDRDVIMSGAVPSRMAQLAAQEDALSVAGVRGVVNELEIRYADRPLPADRTIADNVKAMIGWNAELADSKIKVSARAGKVTLEGTVDTVWKRLRAQDLAAEVEGVVDVENALTVVPTEDMVDEVIAEEILAAVKRNRLLDSETINVEVDGGMVTLSGTVDSWEARERANQAALYTFGVRDVTNNIVVRP